MLSGVTGIVVAHRASTVLLADRVALLSGGTITHVGTHSELMAQVPEYRELLSAEYDDADSLDRECAEVDFARAELERRGRAEDEADNEEFERAQAGGWSR